MTDPLPPEPPDPADRRAEAGPGPAGLLIVLAAAFTASQFYRTAPAVIGPELRSELALGPAELGLAAGAFFIAFSLMHVPIGVLLDRYGPRRVMAAMLALAGAGAVLFARAEGAAGLIAAQLLIGAGCSAMFVGGLVVVAQRFPPARFGGLAALLTSVSGIGMIVSGTPFAALSDSVGWRAAFLISAALSFLLAALVFRAVPRRGERRTEAAGQSLLRSVLELGLIFRHGPVWGVIALAMVAYPAIVAIRGFWGGPYLSDVYGAGTIERGNILLIMSLATMAGAALYALFERRTSRRMPFIYLGGRDEHSGLRPAGAGAALLLAPGDAHLRADRRLQLRLDPAARPGARHVSGAPDRPGDHLGQFHLLPRRRADAGRPRHRARPVGAGGRAPAGRGLPGGVRRHRRPSCWSQPRSSPSSCTACRPAAGAPAGRRPDPHHAGVAPAPEAGRHGNAIRQAARRAGPAAQRTAKWRAGRWPTGW